MWWAFFGCATLAFKPLLPSQVFVDLQAGIGQGAYSLPGINIIGENGGLLSAWGIFCATTDGYDAGRLGVTRCVKIFEFWVNGIFDFGEAWLVVYLDTRDYYENSLQSCFA